MSELAGEFSDRGFFHYAPVADDDGAVVKVYDSSAAMLLRGTWDEPKEIHGLFMWLSVTGCELRKLEPNEAVAHLGFEQATLLRDQINDWLVRHGG